MKVVLFCGGLGMRMRDGVTHRPEADGDDRGAPDAMACHAVLRAFRSHRFRALPRLRRLVCQGLLPELRREPGPTISSSRAAPAKAKLFKTDISDWRITFVDTGPELPDRRTAAAGPPVRRGRADVPGQLRGRLHERAAARHDRAVRSQQRGGLPARGAASVVTPRGGYRRRRAHHERDSHAGSAPVGKRRLLRAPAGDLRSSQRGRRPRRGRARAVGPAAGESLPSRTKGTGHPPTR